MKDLRIKKYICVIFLLIIASCMPAGCSGLALFSKAGLKAERFSQISISDSNGNCSTITDENEIVTYIEAINTALQIDLASHGATLTEYRFVLEGNKPKHSKEFSLFLDESLENRNLYVRTETELKRINDDYFNAFLTKPVFEPVYPFRSPPQVTLQYDSHDFKLNPGSYQWKFKKTDLKYYEAMDEQPDSNGDIGLILTIAGGLPAIVDADTPAAVKWTFLQNDQEVFSMESTQTEAPADNTPNNPLPLPEGTYQCLLELRWPESQDTDYYGKAQYLFDALVDNPPEINISSVKTYPGELLVISAEYVNADEEVTIQTEVDFKPNVFNLGAKKVILLPVSYHHKANKTYSVQVTAGQVSETFQVEVLDKEFKIQYLTIDKQVAAATRNDESAREVTEKIAPLRPVCDDEKYWEGAFIQPVEGGRVRPADFGKRRYVNEAPTSYRHNGLDIAHNQGEPVKAANHGRVLFADHMIGTGNTVIIEHGYGLKSWYYHMVSLNTKTGDMVHKGDIIGLVGSTGFSTGPHLHFAISVNNVYVNPMPFLEEGLSFQEEE
ncbi:MAG: M23 family metallopeptidase [Thermoclostridium sp.]|nr:M23 family metallopeptidase [Thermoclostridium sp.]